MEKIWYNYDDEGFYLSHNYYNEKPHGLNWTDVPILKSFLKSKFTGNKWVEGANYDELLEFQKQEIKSQYEQRRADGWQAYQTFRAEMVLDIDKGILTEMQAFIIENYLGKGYDKIAQNGDWKTASFLLSQTSLPEAHLFVQSYLNKALEIINEYITKNYKQR